MRGRDCVLSKEFNYTRPAVSNGTATVSVLPLRVQYIMTNRGVLSKDTAPGHRAAIADIGLTPANYGCMYRALLRPTKAMLDVVSPDATGILSSPVSVCTHYRSGDSNMVTNGGAHEVWYAPIDSELACAREVLRLLNSSAASEPDAPRRAAGLRLWAGGLRPSDVWFFLSADSAHFKAHATELLGLPGVTAHVTSVSPVHVNHYDISRVGGTAESSAEAEAARMAGALRDWFVLATCRTFAGSIASAFSRTAAAYSLSHHIMTTNVGIPEHAGKGVLCEGFHDLSRFAAIGAGTRRRRQRRRRRLRQRPTNNSMARGTLKY